MNMNSLIPETPTDILRMMGDRIIPDERIMQALHSSKLMENLRDFEISVLAGLINVRYFESQELVAELNDESLKDALMVLVEGKIEVSAIVNHEPMSLFLESAGDLARIISFVGGNTMDISVSIKVKEPSAVLLLQRSKLETLLNSHPAIVYCVMRNLVRHVHGVARRKSADKEELSNYFYRMHGRY